MRPSLPAPPLAEKNVIVGDSACPVPPTVRPGVAFNREPAARDAGRASTVAVSSTTSRRTLWTSTTGVSPVTVIVSSRPPTRISSGTVSVCVPDSTMPSRRTGLKPGSDAVTVYVPGRRSTMRNWPTPSVMATRIFSMRTGLAASTVTPGSTAPELSRTLPARVACANADIGRRITKARSPRDLARVAHVQCLSPWKRRHRSVRRRSEPAERQRMALPQKPRSGVGRSVGEGTGSPPREQPGRDRISGSDAGDFRREIQ